MEITQSLIVKRGGNNQAANTTLLQIFTGLLHFGENPFGVKNTAFYWGDSTGLELSAKELKLWELFPSAGWLLTGTATLWCILPLSFPFYSRPHFYPGRSIGKPETKHQENWIIDSAASLKPRNLQGVRREFRERILVRVVNEESKKHFCDCRFCFSNVELVRPIIMAPHTILSTVIPILPKWFSRILPLVLFSSSQFQNGPKNQVIYTDTSEKRYIWVAWAESHTGNFQLSFLLKMGDTQPFTKISFLLNRGLQALSKVMLLSRIFKR